jgi:hypothetical protein
MTPDLICRSPPPWDHLSLAEVSECERLAAALVGRLSVGRGPRIKRFAELLKRRVRPQYEPARKGAA